MLEWGKQLGISLERSVVPQGSEEMGAETWEDEEVEDEDEEVSDVWADVAEEQEGRVHRRSEGQAWREPR